MAHNISVWIRIGQNDVDDFILSSEKASLILYTVDLKKNYIRVATVNSKIIGSKAFCL